MTTQGSQGCAVISDPQVVEYRSILMRAVKSAKPIRLANGYQFLKTEEADVKEMMNYCWSAWISPMRETFRGYFLALLDDWPEEKLNHLQHHASLTDKGDQVVTVFCEVEFPKFVARCMQDIDAKVHRGVLLQAFQGYVPGSSMSLVDFINRKFAWMPKAAKPAECFFRAYMTRFVDNKPIMTIPHLLPCDDAEKSRMTPQEVPVAIAGACAELLDNKLKAAIALKMQGKVAKSGPLRTVF